MANRGHQLLHADAFAAELEALGLDSSIFGAAGVPAPVFANLIPRRAGVWDANPNTHGFADFSSAFTRASNGLYRDGSGIWQSAGNNILRAHHDVSRNVLGLMFEPEIVNKCENYNANPDSGLTGLTVVGDPAAVLSRVDATAELAALGLEAICTSGLVLKLDNSAASTSTAVRVAGTVGNTNTHTVSGWAKNEAGNPSNCVLKVTGAGSPSVTITSTSWAHYSDTGTPAGTTNQVEFVTPIGSIGYFILNQLEENDVVSSPIITLGASATRAADALSWPISDWQSANFIDQDSGSAVLLVRSAFSNADLPNSVATRFVDLGAGNNTLFYYAKDGAGANTFAAYDGTNTRAVSISAGIVAEQIYALALRWTTTTMQLGFKTGGTWSWSADGAHVAFPSPASIDVAAWGRMSGDYPFYLQRLLIWNRTLSTTVLERLLLADANA